MPWLVCHNHEIDWKTEEVKMTRYSKEYRKLLQTLFSLYFHNQWTNFHKLSYTGKLQMRAICTYMGCTKATTNN